MFKCLLNANFDYYQYEDGRYVSVVIYKLKTTTTIQRIF